MTPSQHLRYLLVFLLAFFPAIFAQAQSVTINKAIPTNSACEADGTLTVNVSVDTNGATVEKIYYSVESTVSGANRAETEHPSDIYNYQFIDLPSGTHKLKIKVILSTAQELKAETNFTIGGNYVRPTSVAGEYVASLVTCDTTGVAYVRVTNGKSPVSVKISAYEGTSTLPLVGMEYQYIKTVTSSSNDYYFHGLPSGKYEFRVQDDCGATDYVNLTLGTINLANYFTYTNSSFESGCRIRVLPYLTIPSSVANYSNLISYYGKHPAITYQVTDGTYTSQKKRFGSSSYGIYDTIPADKTINMSWSGTYTVFDPCGNPMKAATAMSVNNNSIYSNVYPHSSLSATCDTVSISLSTNYIGGKIRALYTVGSTTTILSDWQTITSSMMPVGLGMGEGKTIKDWTGKSFKVEIENKCGGTYSNTVSVKVPTYHIPYYQVTYNCDADNTFNYAGRLYDDYDGVICLPATYTLKNTLTNEIYEVPVAARGVTYWKNNIPCGTYDITLSGNDGYLWSKSTNTFTKPAPSVSALIQSCVENSGYLNVSNITTGTRVQVISSPAGTSYYYDRNATGTSLSVYPNNGSYGAPGDYTLRITDTCGVAYDRLITIPQGYKVTRFNLTLDPTVECDGQKIRTDAQITYNGANQTTYIALLSYPTGHIPPSQNTLSGNTITIKMKGRYIFGVTTYSNDNSCIYKRDTIDYEGAGVRVDLNRSLAFVCAGDPDSEGRIYVQAIGGKAPYTFYVSNSGTHGESVVNDPNKYLYTNTTGDFTAYNFQKGQIYDVTIQDACNSVVWQAFQVGDLSELRLAYVEQSTVCIGSPILFKAMALPNPTYKWFYPGDDPATATPFSTEASPVITAASMAHNGTFHVAITTTLCRDQTVILPVPVVVQPIPTLTRSGGEANQFVCSGSTITDIVYTWGGSVTDVEISGISASYYTKDPVVQTITIRGAISSTCTYTINAIGGCRDLLVSGTITVKTQPTSYLYSGSASQSVCINTPISTFSYYKSGSTTDLSVTGLPPGVTGVYASNRLTISGTPTADGIYTYTVIATTSDIDNPCPVGTMTGVITVNSEDVLTLTSPVGTDNQIVCSNQSIIPIVYTWSGKATNVSVSGLSSGNYLVNTTNKTITINTAGVGVTSYSITTTGGCSAVTRTGQITVKSAPTVNAISSQSVCAGAPLNLSFTGTIIGTTYNWTNDNASIGLPLVGTNTISFTATNTGTTPLVANITVTPSFDNCMGDAKTFTITVNPKPTAILSGGVDACLGSSSTLSVAFTGQSPWSITYTANGGNPIVVNGITSNPHTFSVTPATVGTTTYAITNVTDANTCSNTGAGSAAVLVHPVLSIPVADIIAETVCPNANAAIRVNNSIGGATYNLYSDMAGSNQLDSEIGTGSSILFDAGAITSTTTFYLKITNSPTGCHSNNSVPVEVAVRPTIAQYPDIRLQVCPYPDRPFHLSSYLDTTDFQLVHWVPVTPDSPAPNNTSGTFQTADLKQGTHIYSYTISNTCYQNIQAKVYLLTMKDRVVGKQADTVVVCKDYAGGINLKQVLGIAANGTWSCNDPGDAMNPYVKVVAPPSALAGAMILEGDRAYADFQNTTLMKGYKADPYAVYLDFVYSTPLAPNSCLSNEERRLVVIVTSTLL